MLPANAIALYLYLYWNLCLTFWETSGMFSQVAASFNAPTSAGLSQAPYHFLASTCYLIFLSQPTQMGKVLPLVLSGYWLMTFTTLPLVCKPCVCTSSLQTWCFFLFPIKIIILLLSHESRLNILWIDHFNMFVPCCVFLITSIAICEAKKVFNFDKMKWIYFIVAYIFSVVSTKVYHNPGS